MSKKRSPVFKEKNREIGMTPSLAAPGDTNPSDATVKMEQIGGPAKVPGGAAMYQIVGLHVVQINYTVSQKTSTFLFFQ